MKKLQLAEKCSRCECDEFLFTVRLIPATQYADLPHAPQFVPQIKQRCGKCGVFIKFAKQTPDLIRILNEEEENFADILLK